ncbi:MAG: MarR family transcriptional regulator [Chitinophagia bacterium]|nr:MarR family transcriptional regulator [Chitinophagia bacterium]
MLQKNLNASVIFHSIKLSETWKKNGDLITQQFGITTQQWFILLLLAKDPNILYFKLNPHNQPLMAKELAEAMNVSRANITNMLTVLIRKKLVTQISDKVDKRRKRLSLTPQGIVLVKKLEKLRNTYNKQMLSHFSSEQKKQFVRFIDTCLQLMHH